MRFKDRLKKELNEEHSAILISYMRTFKLNTKAETQKKINYHIEKCRKFLSTGNQEVTRKRRDYTKKLEYYMQIRRIVGRL